MNDTFTTGQRVTRTAILAFGPMLLVAAITTTGSLDLPGLALAAAWIWNPWTASVPSLLLSTGRHTHTPDTLTGRVTAPIHLLGVKDWRLDATLAILGWALVLTAAAPGMLQALHLITS